MGNYITKNKVIWTIVFFLLLPIIPYYVNCVCKMGPCPMLTFTSFLFITAGGFNGIMVSRLPLFLLGIAYTIIIAYLLSYLVTYLFAKLPKEQISKFLEPSKAKVIIASLGWISLLPIFMNSLTGLLGGTMNFPVWLNTTYKTLNLLIYLLFPFFLISVFVLYPICLVIPNFFLIILFRIRMLEHGGLFAMPVGLSWVGAIIVFPLIAYCWYMLACAIVVIWNKIFNR